MTVRRNKPTSDDDGTPPTLLVELRATGQHNAPDTYAVLATTPHTTINVGTDWLFVPSHRQSQCHGIITEIRGMTHDSIVYIVQCILPNTRFFLLVDRARTNNPSSVTASQRALRPHLRDAQRHVSARPIWVTPNDLPDSPAHARRDAPVHHTVIARCVARSEANNHWSTWQVVQANETLQVGSFVELHDADDVRIPLGPAKVVGVHNVERNWVDLIVRIHPHYTRTNESTLLLAAPLERIALPTNLKYVHSKVQHSLPDVYGDGEVYPPPAATNILRRIRSALENLRTQI